MSSVSNGLYFLTLPLVSVMRAIYKKIRHARYLYIERNVEKVWGARYLSKNTVTFRILNFNTLSWVISKHSKKMYRAFVLLYVCVAI